MASSTRLSLREKQRRYRNRLRAQGLRPIQIWAPDTRAPGFAAECRREARLINRSRGEREALRFIAEVADWDGE
ncbi:MAG: antitoxin MazE family protein [Candidatus Binataceae bacterium]